MKRSWFLISCVIGCLMLVFAKQITQGQTTAVSPVTAGFTYQGHLHSDGTLINGACDFRFSLWDAAASGAQVGSSQEITNVPISEGLFTVILNDANQMGEGIFNGEARWLEIWVRCPAGSSGYTVLTPRQPLTATPYALGLQPGAKVLGDLSAPTLTIANSAGDGLVVTAAGNPAGGNGSVFNNGIEVEGAEGHGLYIGQPDRSGVVVGTAGESGVRVGHAAGDGVLICATGSASGCDAHTSSNGVEVVNAEANGLRVNSAGNHGVLVESAGLYGFRVNNAVNAGVRVGHSDGDGLVICSTGVETGCPRSEANNAIEIGNAEHRGVSVNSAGSFGVYVGSAGGSGVLVDSADSTGVWVSSAGSTGVYVGSAGSTGVLVGSVGAAGFRIHAPATNGFYAFDAGDSGIWVRDATNYAGYFGGDIHVTGSCSGCLLATFGVNNGPKALQPGDIVSVAGIQAGPAANTEMLLQVQPAAVGQPLVGVVSGRAELHTSAEDGTTILVSRAGEPAEPNDYVSIIIYGPVQLPTSTATFAAGDRVTLAENGRIRALQTVELNGIPLAEAAPTLGITLEASDSDGDGLVWILVNPH
jgi:hypothetical protein